MLKYINSGGEVDDNLFYFCELLKASLMSYVPSFRDNFITIIIP